MSGPDNGAPARPQLDPHAVWAQNAPGKTASAETPSTGRDGAASYSEATMAEPQFAMHSDDDLPRTLRRERDARRQAQGFQQHPSGTGSAPSIPEDEKRFYSADDSTTDAPAATVTGFDVPFLRLVTFFLKCAIAAIPAVLLFVLLMAGSGRVAKSVWPSLVPVEVHFKLPPN